MKGSIGHYRVGGNFNPSGSAIVDQIKARSAELIDLIHGIEPLAGGGPEYMAEFARLQAKAMTAVEEGAIWAVKAATKPAPPF